MEFPGSECGWSCPTCATPVPAPGGERAPSSASDRGGTDPRAAALFRGFGLVYFPFSPAMKPRGRGLLGTTDVLCLSFLCSVRRFRFSRSPAPAGRSGAAAGARPLGGFLVETRGRARLPFK